MIKSGTDPELAYTMISLTWFIWLFIIIFNVIALLNFLIAFISETYEEVYGRGRIDDFKNMAMLNHECQVILNGFPNFISGLLVDSTGFDYIIVTHADDYQLEEDNDFQGIIKQVQKDTAKHSKIIREKRLWSSHTR